MAKKKKFVADKVRNRKVDTNKKINPFEVKINRQKHDILGRKLTKHDRGLPGVSRSKANKRRKETLLQEYEQRFKANQLVDRRLGENDPNLSVEDKMLRRYAVERERSGVGGGKFNLNEGEELTHYGQSLSEMEKFEDPDISEDEEDSGKIDGDMVAQEHFGGFLTRKDPTSDDTGDNKSWKERMEEMIAKSKKAKFERQSEKEKSMEMTEKLDEQWKDVALLLRDLKGKGSKGESKPAIDDYDIAVRELKYEMKGKPSDRLKTEEEIAKEEKDRLEKLEADRVRRMKGILVDKEKIQPQHQSADSLDDGFVLDTDESDRIKVRFQDGKLVPEDEEDSDKDEVDEEEADDEDNEESEEEEENESDASDSEKDSKSEDNMVDKEDNMVDKEDDDEESDNSEDSYADIVSDSEGEKQEEEQTVPKSKVKSILKKKPETKEDMKKKEEIKKAAKKELPYTFEAPGSYDALLELMEGRSEADQLTIIERVRKCHHASLAEGNKAKMETLLRLLIQYYGSLAVKEVPCLSLIDKLTRHVYELTQTFPSASADTIQRILLNQQNDFTQLRERKKPVLLSLDILLYLKLVCVLFPTSDFSHPVTTPAMLFMGQLISQSPVNTDRDVASGLFLCNLFLEFVSQSKRFVPEVISFLHAKMADLSLDDYMQKKNFRIQIQNNPRNTKGNEGFVTKKNQFNQGPRVQMNTGPQVRVTGLGFVRNFDARQKLGPKQQFDARQQLQKKKPVDARSRLNRGWGQGGVINNGAQGNGAPFQSQKITGPGSGVRQKVTAPGQPSGPSVSVRLGGIQNDARKKIISLKTQKGIFDARSRIAKPMPPQQQITTTGFGNTQVGTNVIRNLNPKSVGEPVNKGSKIQLTDGGLKITREIPSATVSFEGSMLTVTKRTQEFMQQPAIQHTVMGITEQYSEDNELDFDEDENQLDLESAEEVKPKFLQIKKTIKTTPLPVTNPPKIVTTTLKRKAPAPAPVQTSGPLKFSKPPGGVHIPVIVPQKKAKVATPVKTVVKQPKVFQVTEAREEVDDDQDVMSPLQGYRVYVTNLHPVVNQDDIIELFGAIGALRKAKLIKQGTAEVVYVKKDDALKAVQKYHNRELDGLPMQVKLLTSTTATIKVPTVVPSSDDENTEASPSVGGPLKLSKQPSSAAAILARDGDSSVELPLVHKALFKLGNQGSSKPVTFTVKI